MPSLNMPVFSGDTFSGTFCDTYCTQKHICTHVHILTKLKFVPQYKTFKELQFCHQNL